MERWAQPMALYNVINFDSKPGDVESALIVTVGQLAARKVFAERFGGEVAKLAAERVDTAARADGPYVYATWDNESPAAEPTLADWEPELLDDDLTGATDYDSELVENES